MLNDLIDGISVTLNSMFGDEVKIHSEEVKQGFKGPCFFILPIEPQNANKLGHRAHRKYPFDVHYFPKTETNQEMYEVAEKLYLGLEYIELLDGSTIRSSKMRYEIVDGVLHFMMECAFYVNKPYEQDTAMQDLETVMKGK